MPNCFQDFNHNYKFLYAVVVLLLVSRKVLREVASGGRDAERVKIKLEIVVEVIYHLSISGVSVY